MWIFLPLPRGSIASVLSTTLCNGRNGVRGVFTCIVWQAMEKGLVGGKYLFTDSTHLKASANKNKKHNEKREVRVSRYIDMLNQDVAKVREEKGKKPLKASEKAAEVKDTKVSNTASESG